MDERPRRLLLRAILVVSAVLLGGCLDASPLPLPSSGGPSVRPVPPTVAPTRTPSGSPVEATEPSGDLAALRAEDAGLRLSVALDRTTVEPGGTVVVTATIENGRDVPVEIGPGWCGTFVDAFARFALPTDPVGRSWDGIAGEFKAYALSAGLAPGGVPADSDVEIHATSGPRCDDVGSRPLAPGASAVVVVGLEAGLVPGVPAPAGHARLQVTVAHDPDPPPSPNPPAGKCCVGSWVQTWHELTVSTSIEIAGPAPHPLSIGEAIDALLADRRFASWLDEKPARTWSVANVFLESEPRAEGILPAGPSWDIELFREIDVPRNWAIGFVDPLTGAIRSLTFCNVPCDR
jgi:hypothetical protein